MAKAYLALVLHAHLPFVRHPEYPHFLEEGWLFEAITESYLPLLRVFEGLARDGIPFRVTLSLSPTLAAMLADDLLQDRYLAHLERLVALAEAELRHHRKDRHLRALARFYLDFFRQAAHDFTGRWQRDLNRAFAALEEGGHLEIITSAATHAYLPLLRPQPEAVRAQILLGVQSHTRRFGRQPAGFWLPECGYHPGLEGTVAEAGCGYFIVDTHGITGATPPPPAGVASPIRCPNGVAVFGRDPESSHQVWSATDGYPGDPDYRDFHCDIGTADGASLWPEEGYPAAFTGIKYFRVGGPTGPKALYEPDRARAKAALHARDFLDSISQRSDRMGPALGRPPLTVAPFDAELFGHWWFEGPQWLDFVLRHCHGEASGVETLTLSQYLGRHSRLPTAVPMPSSWGEGGYNGFWLNGANDWVYPPLHRAARRMVALADAHPQEPADPQRQRALGQAARNLLLAQASDWPFLMKAGPHGDYGRRRVREHLARFRYLASAVDRGQVDERHLRALEQLDPIFPDLDYRLFSSAAGSGTGSREAPIPYGNEEHPCTLS